jgi:hypothetical protein
MDCCQCNVRSVSLCFGGKKPCVHDIPGQLARFVSGFEQRNIRHKLDPAMGHFGFSKGDLVEHKLAGKKIMAGSSRLPPVASELLARGLQ